ncbi:MAG TPA: hypothetical protein VHE37_16360 [Nevskiaceae bacterium]|nr:hypothetical protein [Nevskiaceae bacterium]
MQKHLAALSCAVLFSAAAVAAPADEKPFKEGPVTDVSYIRVKDGKFFDYMAYLDSTWKTEQEALKKAGLILDYRVYGATPHSPHDANLVLTITYPNYAALDRTAEFEAVTAKVEGSLKASDKAFGDRDSIREILGDELVQELMLK